jgi:hypothetical protein
MPLIAVTQIFRRETGAWLANVERRTSILRPSFLIEPAAGHRAVGIKDRRNDVISNPHDIEAERVFWLEIVTTLNDQAGVLMLFAL